MLLQIPLFAEVKTVSPFGYVSPYRRDDLFALAVRYGAVVAVHTDQRWGGSFEWLTEACRQTHRPIMAKGIHERDDELRRAFDVGAACALAVRNADCLPADDLLDRCLVEVTTLDDLQILAARGLSRRLRLVWNQRDLTTGKAKTVTFAMARATWPGWLCQASLVRTVADGHPLANAVLVGTNLVTFVRSMS